MPPRDDHKLPEGTDQIINGASETGASSGQGGTGGSSLGGGGDYASGTGTLGGSGGGGFIGAGGGNDTGGFAGSGGSGLGGGGSSGFASGGGSDFGATGGGRTGRANEQLKGGVQNLKGQATDKVRSYAVDGKNKATSALDDLSQVVNEAAQSIDERLGHQYGEYARRAATAVSGFADTIRGKEVDELFDDARDVVRKSPGIAIGAAAVIGFTLVRLVKAGMTDTQPKDVQFQADPQLAGPGSDFTPTTGAQGAYAAPTTGSQAPYVSPTTGV